MQLGIKIETVMVQHFEHKKMEELKRIREAIDKGESLLPEEEAKSVEKCSDILGKDGSSRVTSLAIVVIDAREGNSVHVMKEFKKHIRLLH